MIGIARLQASTSLGLAPFDRRGGEKRSDALHERSSGIPDAFRTDERDDRIDAFGRANQKWPPNGWGSPVNLMPTHTDPRGVLQWRAP